MKKMLMGFVVGAAVWVVAPEAQAQFTPSPVYNTYANSIYADMTNNRMMNEYLINKRMGKAAGGRGSTGRNTTVVGPGSFRASATSIMPARLAAAETNDPAERRKRTLFLEQRLRDYERLSGQRGRPVKDLADAVTSFIVVSYNAHKGDGVVTGRQLEAAREQLRAVYAADPKIKAMTNRQKQEMYETAAIMCQLMSFGYDTAEAAGNRQAMQQFKQMARQNLEEALNTSVNNIHFTDNGIEIR